MPARRRPGRRARSLYQCADLELLEVRRLLNNPIVVTTLDDETTANGKTSLREAITLANSTPGDDTITFDPTLFPPTPQQTITPLGEPFGITDTTGKTTITGPGNGLLAIDGSQAGRSFDVETGANASITDISIVNGLGSGLGGGIRSLGTLSLDNTVFNNNQAVGLTDASDGNATLAGSDGLDLTGGAISSTGPLTVTNSTFTGNFVRGQNGGSSSFGAGNGGDGLGGAIYANAATTIANCMFIDNLAQGGKAGQKTGANADGASGDGIGGAVYLGSNAVADFTNDTFTNNEALGGTGADASGAHAAGNGADGFGGAVYTLGSNLNILLSRFESNQAFGGTAGSPDTATIGSTGGNGGQAIGGALWSQSDLGITDSTFTTNSATGADPDPTAVLNTAFASEALGGAMFINGTNSILRSTIDHNDAIGADAVNGGTGGFAAGGGIYMGGSLELTNSTVYGNNATGGAGGDVVVVVVADRSSADVTGQGVPITAGGDGGKALGGGIACDNVNALNTVNATIASNNAIGGPGGTGTPPGSQGEGDGGGIEGSDVFHLTNTIVADNTASFQGPDIFTGDAIVMVNDLISTEAETGYQIDVANSSNYFTGQPADLGPLGNNGGPTFTALPQPGSKAIDNGDNASAIATFGADGTDQRGTGFARINGAKVDIGAVETEGDAILTMLGNGQTIANGDDTPRTADNTAFGTTKLGTPIDKTFTIRNDGASTLNLGFITLPFGFTVTKPFAATVDPGKTTTFTVRFNPNLPGTQQGNVEISNNAGGHLSHFDFTLSATANGGAFRVNFQPAASEVPLTYLADSGQVFGNRGNGYSYGWNASIVTGTRDRNAVGDQARDTFVHTQLFGTRTWEVAVPNGTYIVHVVAGDPSFTDSVYKFNVEGVLTVNGTPTAANHFVEGTKTVTVSDGKLTISNASGAVNNKLDFVEITPVYHINFQTTTSPTPAGYLADSGSVFGNHNGLSYGWNQSATSAARDRNNKLSPDQLHDTFIHTQLFGNRSWDLALANGSYQVHVVAGDPDFFDSTYKFAAEGQTILSGTPTNSKHWIEATATVLVLDGKLTITNAAGAVNNKIDYIDVTAM